MSLLLARLSATPIVTILSVAMADGHSTMVGVGINGAAVDGSSHLLRTIYAVDPPNRFWPDPSLRTY